MTDRSDELRSAIQLIEYQISVNVDNMPDGVFLFLSRVTPMVNVDLLIRDDARRTLLTWRSDQFYGPGWHVPGGVIRFKETAAERIHAVAKGELGTTVEFDPEVVLMQESIVSPRRDRGHFISLLYRCRLGSDIDERLRCSGQSPLPGQWQWHDRCPENLIPEQRAYAAYMA